MARFNTKQINLNDLVQEALQKEGILRFLFNPNNFKNNILCLGSTFTQSVDYLPVSDENLGNLFNENILNEGILEIFYFFYDID